jgi:hypothetical protein
LGGARNWGRSLGSDRQPRPRWIQARPRSEAEGRGRGTPGLGFQGAGCEPRDEARVESHKKNKAAMRCQMTDGRERVRCWEGVAHRWGWRVLDGAKRRGGLDQV